MESIKRPEVKKSAEIFRYRLRHLIDEKDMRMIDMPDEIGMTRGTVSRYLSGDSLPKFSHMLAIAEYFRVSIDWLTGVKENSELTAKEKDILDMFSKATESDKELINLILKKYND